MHALSYLIIALTLYSSSKAAIARQSPSIQLATTYKKEININHYFVSEKLDGVRGYWDGKQLTTKRGNTINAPQYFLHNWPNTPLEGELWSKRNDFENIVSCVRKKVPVNNCWQSLSFMLFDIPNGNGKFTERLNLIKTIVKKANTPYLAVIKQNTLSSNSALQRQLSKVVNNGGEGLMLHYKNALYKEGRSKNVMKLKQHQDAEALVIEHLPGKGKYTNMLGALLVETPEGLQFKIGSGFSDKQRQNPPRVGSTITYKYIGKTGRGVPRFASFVRIREIR